MRLSQLFIGSNEGHSYQEAMNRQNSCLVIEYINSENRFITNSEQQQYVATFAHPVWLVTDSWSHDPLSDNNAKVSSHLMLARFKICNRAHALKFDGYSLTRHSTQNLSTVVFSN